jgi:hypothetical protein
MNTNYTLLEMGLSGYGRAKGTASRLSSNNVRARPGSVAKLKEARAEVVREMGKSSGRVAQADRASDF